MSEQKRLDNDTLNVYTALVLMRSGRLPSAVQLSSDL
jgi:hypothetical protein